MERNSLGNLEFYDGGDETEAYLARSYHQMRLRIMAEMVEQHVRRYGRAHRALDIGCSAGTCTEMVLAASTAANVIGLDISLGALQRASRRRMHSVVADVAASLPFSSDAFDLIIAGELIEHLIDVDAFLNEIRRCLRPDGLLVLSTPNLARLIDRIRFVFGICPKQTIPMHRYLRYHVTPFTLSSLRETLERCQFTRIRFRSNVVYLDPSGRTKVQSRLLAELLPSLGGSLICCCQKGH